MRFRLDQLTGSNLERAAEQFETQGYFMLEGVSDLITRHYKPLVAEQLGVDADEFERVLDPDSPPVVLPEEVRKRLSRITSTSELQQTLTTNLNELLRRLLGPFVHVSSTFHGQFKGGEAKPVDHGGYDPNARYLEVQGQYLIHQDFAGAALPTSPCGVTLWTPLNSCQEWNLRLYPGSHRYGLLCHEWMKLDDPRLGTFSEPIDVKAEYGTAVVFNALLLHASSNPGYRRRVSCDIRFFPLCAFLPSAVHVLSKQPLAEFRRGLNRADGPTLREPFLEAAAFMGVEREIEKAEPYSILNWSNFVRHTVDGDLDAALADLARFVNEERGIDRVEAYSVKFHDKTVHAAPLAGLLERLRVVDPAAPEVAALSRRVAELTALAR